MAGKTHRLLMAARALAAPGQGPAGIYSHLCSRRWHCLHPFKGKMLISV